MSKAKQLPSVEIMPANLLAFGDDGEAFERHTNLGKMHALAGIDAVAMVELGRRLIWHKAKVNHGEFLVDLGQLPFTRQQAARLMNVARKLDKSNVTALLHLGIAKIFELVQELPEPELQKLIETKATDLIGSIDDIDRMSVRELRTALRKERKPKRRLVAAEERVKDLESEVAALKGQKLSPSVEQAQKQVRAFVERFEEGCRQLAKITIPDDGDETLADRGKIVAKIAAVLTEAEMRLQNLQEALVTPFMID